MVISIHLVYYSIIDAILVLSIPLASAIVINSVLSHASLSLIVVGTILLILFVFITILQLLKEANGTIPFTYKSDAEEIKKIFGMSKKNFKRTLTELIESKKIKLNEDSIVLL